MCKRIIDILLSLILIIFMSFPFLLICVAVRIKLGTPIFFRQSRPGLNGSSFTMIKFRTMANDRDSFGKLQSDSQRTNSFGMFLRSTSLDELPELWNILKGDMSFVGPRPLLTEYLPLYTKEQSRRHEVKPGLTGWAQVNGRNAIGWDQKFELDVWYVDNQCLKLDIKILLLTIKKVIFREGISAPGELTMPFFKGTIHKDNE